MGHLMDSALVLAQEKIFPEQVDTTSLAVNVYYVIGVFAAVLVLIGLILVEIGAGKRSNMLNGAVQKMIGFFTGLVAYSVVGHAVWNLQFYVAFDIPNPVASAFSDWWLGGTLVSGLAHELDPAQGMNEAANTQQVFFVLLAIFAGLLNVLLHFSVTERIKASAYYIISAVAGGITFPIMAWLMYGPTGPLTNAGVHDFFGALIIYIPIGVMSLILGWRIRPRIGGLRPDSRLPGSGAAQPANLGFAVAGVLIVLCGLYPIILASGYIIPDVGYLGINMTETSIGALTVNYFMAITGGALVGGIIAYRTKNSFYLLLGALGGYIAGVPSYDIFEPWQMLLVSLPAPVFVYLVMEGIQKLGIEDSKLVPLGLGSGIYGMLVLGVVSWGTPTGGFLGIEEGPYAFQNAEINLWWQLIGIGTSVGIAALTMAIVLPIIAVTVGLRVPAEVELAQDAYYWETLHHLSADCIVDGDDEADASHHGIPAMKSAGDNADAKPAGA